MRKINSNQGSSTARLVGLWSFLAASIIVVGVLSFSAPFSRDAQATTKVEEGAIVAALGLQGMMTSIKSNAVIAEIVAFGALIVKVFNELFGGIDGLNTQITQLFKLETDIATRLTQAKIDAMGQRVIARQYADIALVKSVATSVSREWCFQVHADRMDVYMDRYRDALMRSISGHNYAFTPDGVTTSFNILGGHANSSGEAPTNNTAQSMVEQMTVGCAIGAKDRLDFANTTVNKESCDTSVATALGNARSLGTDPSVIFMNSMFLPSGTEPTAAGSTASDVGVREHLFRIQMYYCATLRGNRGGTPVGASINTPSGAKEYHNMGLRETAARPAEQMCLAAVADHAQVPCNGVAAAGFADLCKQLQILCNNRKAKGDDISSFPGCVDGSGSLSPAEVRAIRAENCASANSSVARGQGAKTSTDEVIDALNSCSNERAKVRDDERRKEIAIRAAILRSK